MLKRWMAMVFFWCAHVGAVPAFAAEVSSAGSGAAVYAEECGSCHLAYPPRLLPQASWAAVLDGLAEHFGTDARVDAATLPLLRAHLYAAARRQRPGDVRADGRPIVRITELPWFRGEHRRFDRDRAWQRPAIGSAANCGACHRDADRGKFGEHGIRVPK